MELILACLFWVAFLLGVYVYFVYPLILAILAGLFGKPVRKNLMRDSGNWPQTALLIACFNEEKEIEAKIENALNLEYPSDRLLILVLNDGSKDQTVGIAESVAKRHPERSIKVLDFKENRGKCRTLLNGVEWIRQNHPEIEILAFTDANAHWETDALGKIVEPFEDEKIGSVSGLLRYQYPDGAPAGEMEGLYWKYEAMIKRLSSRLGSLPGANGSIFALRLSAYEPLTDDRGDDFELPIQAIIKGYRSILVEDAISKEAPSSDFQTEYKRKVRIISQMLPSIMMLLFITVRSGKGLLAFQILSHKLLRYLVPFFQIVLLLTAGFLWNYSTFYKAAFLIQVLFYLLAGFGLLIERSGHRPPKIFQIPLYFTMVNFASLVSIIRTSVGAPVHWEKNR
jgi:cellulose synthase/poly-beta-1,6-N-acetylglucosamine synthase-like glycosyltransferase